MYVTERTDLLADEKPCETGDSSDDDNPDYCLRECGAVWAGRQNRFEGIYCPHFHGRRNCIDLSDFEAIMVVTD
jgi:hypothetical protein